jgi:ABC-2 type transport system permease protein
MAAQAPSLRLAPRPKYWALVIAAIQRAITYRGTTLLSLLSGLVWVAVLFYLWRTVYADQPRLGNFDWNQMRTYILVSYAVSTLISFSSAARILSAVRTGDIVMELLRPVDYLLFQLAQTFGSALIEGLLGSIIALLLGFLLLGIAPPASVPAALLFLISVGLGFLIKFLITFLVALLCFWTTNGLGLIWAQTAVISLFSGALIPLQLLPGWLGTVALAAPFQGIVYTPVMIYMGVTQGAALWWALGLQLVWVIVLWRLARLMWMPALRALDLQGG